MQNQKILEELQQQKQRLRMQAGKPAPIASITAAGAPSATSPLPAVPATPPMMRDMAGDTHHMSSSQRAALQHAHANSFGYFITQDSSFGNLILPVLPRCDVKTS